MTDWRTIADVRREYGVLSLNEDEAEKDPFSQFRRWFEEIVAVEKYDPTAMVLSTVDEKGFPDSRVVLLKGIENEAFIFYTNYESTKAVQIMHTPYVALNFYWPVMSRQVRIRGRVKKTATEQSDAYFKSRPLESQLSAVASPQSKKIENRQDLEKAFNKLVSENGQQAVVRPTNWGGYLVLPDEVEFWQGRDNRLHDRLHYFQQQGEWTLRRLAP